ncbi:acetyltransferase [Leptospira ellinghausenii]|uniref:Acetyltransferase n=1 Tax=Leptospira ellinghausenii TaxID=1917822 RepID=A0A2P2DDJ1_9LEPT|nr:acetyltransferase [Leptospira ellinghausenii]GBF42692.1 acetyltransferase [Leptospira ellinghausenii]
MNSKKKNLVCLLALLLFTTGVHAGARKTVYPVVFAHGLSGFDNLLGYYYFGNDYGTFVGDPCDEFLETACNGSISSSQKALAASVTPFQSSEVRGTQLADRIQNYMTSTGATKVNIIGHSQGGIDARKAAAVLRARYGRQVVHALISVSSPHRGSPTAKYILDLGPGVTSVVNALAKLFGNAIYGSGNDGIAAAKQLVYNDYSSTDGITTGMKAFNTNYNVNSSNAAYWGSIITAQDSINTNPALYLLKEGFYNIDGDGYCVDDCDNDGAAGKGDGTRGNNDDDGLVGINSQQMGDRLQYNECALCFDWITVNTSLGYVSNLNAPTSAQMTSKSSVVSQDHLDVVGVPPDTFDEEEFYASILDFIVSKGG